SAIGAWSPGSPCDSSLQLERGAARNCDSSRRRARCRGILQVEYARVYRSSTGVSVCARERYGASSSLVEAYSATQVRTDRPSLHVKGCGGREGAPAAGDAAA